MRTTEGREGGKYSKQNIKDIINKKDRRPRSPIRTSIQRFLPTTELLVQVPVISTISQLEIGEPFRDDIYTRRVDADKDPFNQFDPQKPASNDFQKLMIQDTVINKPGRAWARTGTRAGTRGEQR
jgi:hypothetical protein